MRKHSYILLLMVLACISYTCTVPNDNLESPLQEDILTLQFKNKTVRNTITEFDLEIQANCVWKILNSAEWLDITPEDTSYCGTQILKIRVLENAEIQPRSTSVFFFYGDNRDTLSITQEAFVPYLNISQGMVDFGYRTAEKNILIVSNCSWFAKASDSWTAIRPSTGLIGNIEMTINVETNNVSDPRRTNVIIWNEEYGIDQSIDITQAGMPELDIRDYVDEYGINWGGGVEIRGLFWAPVNCGYEEIDYPAGKMYQWGRKTGLGYRDEHYKDVSVPVVSEIWTGKNGEEIAGVFYKYADDSKYNYDWIKEGDETYWNMGTEEYPVKNSRFDPCPDGWRVPTAFEFRSLTGYVEQQWEEGGSAQGYSFIGDDVLFLPAGGRLNVVDGKAYDRGIEGYYWSNSANAGSSAYLYFHSKGCSINGQGSRAGGCLVRCVRE
jgi:uncharacterized protein (TIGR02145 family)